MVHKQIEDDVCPDCKGIGWISEHKEDGEMVQLGAMLCGTCDGKGRIGDDGSDVFSIGDDDDE